MSKTRVFVYSPTTLIIGVFCSIIFLSGCSAVKDQTGPIADSTTEPVVAAIDGKPIYLSEFRSEYDRTAVLESDAGVDSLTAYLDFLDRYANFRLKVMEAKEAGYHELPDLTNEINGYRSQLARPFVLKAEVTDPIIRLMFERRQEMVDASHILLRLPPNAAPADTAAAHNRLTAIRDSVNQGISFGELARRHSEDPSARGPEGSPGASGHLGYFGGGRMVDQFEDHAYATAVDSVSSIFRTQFGYHILQVHDRAPMPGDIRIAHIMVRPATPTPEDSAAALSKIQSVQRRIAAGEMFEDMAAEYSEDRGTANDGGALQRIGYDGGLPMTMRDAAYALAEGDVSDVIETAFGLHLVRVLELFAPESFEETYDRLSGTIATLPRAQNAEKAFSRMKRIEYGGKVDSMMIQGWLDNMGADSLLRNLSMLGTSGTAEGLDGQLSIGGLLDSTYSVGQFASFLSQNRVPGAIEPETVLWTTAANFLDSKALEYEISALEERNQEFAQTMMEFREGLILFRLMEDSVWTAASIDTVGLEAYYAPRSENYRFDDRNRIITFSYNSDSLLTDYGNRISTGAAISEIISEIQADTTITVRIDTTMIESTSNSIYDQAIDLGVGGITPTQLVNGAWVVLYNDGIEPARRKTFDEARAQAVNEYQTVLEERLVSRLRKKYSLVLYPDQLQYLLHPGS